jgi:hypothetical protein
MERKETKLMESKSEEQKKNRTGGEMNSRRHSPHYKNS